MGNVSHHDVLYSDPVLPGGSERHLVCGQHGALPSQGHKEGPRTHEDKDSLYRDTPWPLFRSSRACQGSPQGMAKGSSGQEGARWLVSQFH